ncbi:hypothetical protein DICVIV_09644 [Dictyocaulus viviparus]|uniref:DSBA-like thioredoxin domain-containing protein n=1 Tax=Dictyocaulus viviparus TaxID=29172 RepID=A0A0D8XIB8_DICVI|nr:hypothetical protein DICVIV_09644 [Dictyocaulus viviparus]
MGSVELIPISDRKLYLIRTYDERIRQRRDNKTIRWKARDAPKSLALNGIESGSYILPNNWQECYSSALENGTILPAIFLSSVKYHLPQYFIRSVEVVGRRVWQNRLPTFKGAHLFACAREAGLTFKESDEIISRLPHKDTRQLLHKNSEEAFRLGAMCAPLLVCESDDTAQIFENFHDFEQSVLHSEL